MLETQSLQQLRQLKLTGLADALELQFTQPNTYDELFFAERIGLTIQPRNGSWREKAVHQK